MLPVHVVLVSLTRHTDAQDVSHVAAALQQQVLRDVTPIWGVTATVDVFPHLRGIPAAYWPVAIVDDVKGAAGYHQDKMGHPYALVEYSDSWSLTASHEVIEMLCDPLGRRVASGRSPKPDQGQVEFLIEACDPCESADFAYTINGVLVSDFITPHYYDPRTTTGARYSFTGSVTRPREILRGGYVSWWEPQSNHVWQETWFDGDAPAFRDLGSGGFSRAELSLREFVDSKTEHPGVDHGLPDTDDKLTDARVAWQGANESAEAIGARFEEEISQLLGES